MKKINFNENWRVSVKAGQFGRAVVSDEKTVTLPYDAMINRERKPDVIGSNKKGFYENNTWEYKKTFFVAEEQREKKSIFEFEGVYQRAMVYINGDYAGQQPYGYSQFLIEADRYLRYGTDNEITVVTRTADDSRWYTGAGIYRDVHMLTSSRVYIKPFGVKITTPDINKERAVINVEAHIKNESANPIITVNVLIELFDADGTCVASGVSPCTIQKEECAVLRQRLYIKAPKLWDVETPHLYSCKVSLTGQDDEFSDECTEKFGVRSLSLDYDSGLRINGNVVKLRGSCIHHDNGPLGAASMYDAEKRRVSILKNAGFNSVRVSHNPAGKAFLNACDEIGMLVIDEAFDMWTTSKSDFDYALDFPEWWERDVRAMVNNDFNHPCVIMYSIGNEIQDTGSANGSIWSRKLSEKIRKLDPTRFVTNGINGMVSVMELLINMQKDNRAKMQEQSEQGGGEINNMMAGMGEMMKKIQCMEPITKATEESFSCLDVAGYNYMDSRYEMDRNLFPNRIIVGIETFPPDIDMNWRKVNDNGNILGDFTWTGWDYLGEAGIGKVTYPSDGNIENVYGTYPSLTAMVGDIDINGNRRPISFYREIVFGFRTTPYIAVQRPQHYNDEAALTPWSWSDSVSHWSWDGYEGKPIRVEVYSHTDEVELLINGKVVGRQPTGEENRFKTVFETTYEHGEIVAVAYQNNKEMERYCLNSSKGRMKLSVESDKLELKFDTSSLVYVDISIVDDDGNLFGNQNRKITVLVDGAGQLAGLSNADPDTEENFFDTERTTYDGRALAIIRPTQQGEIKIKVSADELEEQYLSVVSK